MLKKMYKEYRLKDITTKIGSGATPKGGHESYQEEGIPLIRSLNVYDDGFRTSGLAYLDDQQAKKLSNVTVQENDVLLNITGASVARCCIVPSDLVPARVNQHVSIIRVKPELVDSKFISILLTSKTYKNLLLHHGESGSTRQAITKLQLEEFVVSLPPLSEQKRIVAILDEAFANISQAVANAEKNLANARELFDSYLNEVFTHKGEGWEEKYLSDGELLKIIDGDRGSNYPTASEFFPEEYCLFLSTKNVRPDGFKFNETMFITKEKDQALRKGKLQRLDVVLTTRGTIGNVAIYDEKVDFENIRINSGMLIFRPNQSLLLSEYLFEVLRSNFIKKQINASVSGAAQPQLPIKTINNFKIPVHPSIEKQKFISNKIKKLSCECEELEDIYRRKLAALAELKQALLQKAFTGELTAADQPT
ncbi:restriction endonuclease subunit S [Thiothrix unzii]|jgi:type I restriction enzyme S subunit|uniref:restriction endonuclease subunit S n=1 Tax=Thiothrix unzii TaxID=111769 RepID=UPI002A36866E|nr:restriction endonuclease subunit S [Thiothrix unzii]MDX9989502.1 restriction endonuclease subunit S [Thiothrix unzii]